jgi:hypothetical protein
MHSDGQAIVAHSITCKWIEVVNTNHGIISVAPAEYIDSIKILLQ